MASTDLTTAAYGSNFNIDFNKNNGSVGARSRTIDATVIPLTMNVNYKVLAVAAGTLVRVTTVCETSETTADTDTLDLGVTEAGTEITSNFRCLAGTVTGGTLVYFAADGFIYLKPDADITTAKFTIFCEVVKKA